MLDALSTFWYGPPIPTAEEMMRASKRILLHAQSSLARSREDLCKQAARHKAAAHANRTNKEASVASIRNQLMCEAQAIKLQNMEAKMQMEMSRIEVHKSTQALVKAVRSITRILYETNGGAEDARQIERMVMEYEKQTEQMNNRQEQIGEAMDGFGDDTTASGEPVDVRAEKMYRQMQDADELQALEKLPLPPILPAAKSRTKAG